jgi:hypothetical protein
VKFAAGLLTLFLLSSSTAADEKASEYILYKHELPDWGERFQLAAGTAKDRCQLHECLCSVSPPVSSPQSTFGAARRYSLYFSEAGYVPKESQKRSLENWIKKYSFSTSITLIGYTDSCGTHDYNEKLVRNRVSEVRQALAGIGYSKASSIIFRAEASYGHDPSSRRVDVIVHQRSRLTTMIEKVQADVYLIDASGSMWGSWRKWSDIVAVSFKPGSRIYLSKSEDCYSGQSLDKVSPSGGTEIWYSYWKVLDKMNPGETLVVISDFQSTVPLTRREAEMIEEKVRSKDIRVIALKP